MADLSGRIFLLALQHIFFSNPKVGCEILKIAGSTEAAFGGDRNRFRACFGREEALFGRFLSFCDWPSVEKESEKAAKLGIDVIGIDDEAYPPLLREIYDPPVVLYARGNGKELLDMPAVAIVGSRKASANSLRIAASIATCLSERGVVVVSGMALGLDSAAHAGALQGCTGTIAVMGCGPDILYPPTNCDLSRRIADSGLIISEFPLGTSPRLHHFPQRNRIISGMCIAAIIVEAAERSGSLITARLALEQGREVMACPGLAGLPQFRGNNRLIREGAALVESGEDVLEILAARLPAVSIPETAGHLEVDGDMHSALLLAIESRGEASVDEIVADTGMETRLILEDITRLAISGLVIEKPGRRFSINVRR
ncbi:MAG: DNA-processing protein DprA [Pseudomonadota bacterium]